MCKERKPLDYIGYDLFGYEYNAKYPPIFDNKEYKYDGYATPNESTFFYDFCILGYGVAFSYKDCEYEVKYTEADQGPILLNYTTGEIQGPFVDAVFLMENTDFDGKNLIEILNDLGYVTLH